MYHGDIIKHQIQPRVCNVKKQFACDLNLKAYQLTNIRNKAVISLPLH